MERKKLGVEDAVTELQSLSLSQVVLLGKNSIRTIDDIAGLTPDELRFLLMEIETEVKVDDLWEMTESDVGRLIRNSPIQGEEANSIIMAARQLIYGDDVLTPDPITEVDEDLGVPNSGSEDAPILPSGRG